MLVNYRGYTVVDEGQDDAGEWKTVAQAFGAYVTCGLSLESQEQARQNCLEHLDVMPRAAERVGQRGGKGRGLFHN